MLMMALVMMIPTPIAPSYLPALFRNAARVERPRRAQEFRSYRSRESPQIIPACASRCRTQRSSYRARIKRLLCSHRLTPLSGCRSQWGLPLAALVHDSRALRRVMRAAGHRATVARYVEVIDTGDLLNDAVTGVVPDVHADSTRAGPLVLIPHVVVSRRLPRLLRALPAQPSREAARWGANRLLTAARRTGKLTQLVDGDDLRREPIERLASL
jgi:hypothetical protein